MVKQKPLILTLPQEDVGAFGLFSNSSANPHVQFLQAFFFFGPDPHSAARYNTIDYQTDITMCISPVAVLPYQKS